MVQPFWPNEDDALLTAQAEVDSTDAEALLLAFAGTGVVSGCAVTESAVPGQKIDIAAGVVAIAGTTVAVSADTDKATTAAHATLYRIDNVSVNTSGTVILTTGTAAVATDVVAPA